MERRRFGPTNSQVAVIGQGTWYIDSGDRATAVAALRRGLDLGMTHIDTAEMYGRAPPRRSSARRSPAAATRSSWSPRSCPRTPRATGRSRPASGRSPACDTDRLDCYLLHWRGQHPLEDTIAAFEQLQREGKILSWGVSNFDVPDLEEAWEIAGEGRLACNQVLYHLQERAIEHAVLPWCEEHGVAVVAYSPFGHGHFPGPRTPGGRVLAGDRRGARRHPAPGRAAVPGAASVAVHDPQGVPPRARRRERGGRRSPADRSRARADRRGLPARPPSRMRCPCYKSIDRQRHACLGPPLHREGGKG